MNLSIELKTRIYNHIGQVQQHLSELSPDEQREILQSIETHIHDAFESRSNGNPSPELLEAILAEMDPPQSYGEPSTVSTRVSTARKPIGRPLIVLLIVTVVGISMLIKLNSENEPPKKEPANEQIIPQKQIKKVITEPMVGKWTTIDFVSSISQFDPTQQKQSDDFAVYGLNFLADGTTDKPWWTWKGNQLFHSGDRSVAEVRLVTINQTEYLFMEWLSGDVLTDKEQPKYYVFKRGAYMDPAVPKIITEGLGWNTASIGKSKTELITELGPPEKNTSSTYWLSWQKTLHIRCGLDRGDKKITQLNFLPGFDGQTSKGIKMGSTEEEVLAAYGTPQRISTGRTTIRSILPQPRRRVTTTEAPMPSRRSIDRKTMTWLDQGIQIELNAETGVTQIDIIPIKP